MSWTTKFFSLCWGAPCVLGHAFSTSAVHNSDLALNYCLCRSSRSARGERLWPFQFSPGHAQSPTKHSTYRFLGICWSFSKPLMNISFPRFPFQILANILFAPTGISASGSSDVKQLLLNIFFSFFSKCPGVRTFLTEPALSQVKKDKPCKSTFQGSCQVGQIVTIFLGCGFLGRSKPDLLASVADRLLVF